MGFTFSSIECLAVLICFGKIDNKYRKGGRWTVSFLAVDGTNQECVCFEVRGCILIHKRVHLLLSYEISGEPNFRLLLKSYR